MNQNFSSASSFKNISQEVLNKIKDKSITHNITRTQYNDSIMCRFYCITLIEYMLTRKTLFNYTNYFLRLKINKYISFKYIRILSKITVSLELKLKKIDEIKHNALMSEKYKKTYKNLNYVKHLLILVSTITSCVLTFSFTSFTPVGIASSAIGT